MKKIKLVCILLLTAALLLSGCGAGNRNNYGQTVAATYGDKTIYLDEANFWLRIREVGSSYWISIYSQLYGIDAQGYWAMDSGVRNQTVAENLKEDVMAEFLQIYILLDHASEYDTELSEEELAEIDAAIAEMKDGYGKYLFSESIIGNYSDEALRESIITRTKALKVWNGVREQATTTVTDEECKSFTLEYVSVSDSADSDSADSDTATIAGKDLAELLASELESGKSFSEAISAFSSLELSTRSFQFSDTETTSLLFTEGKTMTEGQIRLISDETGTSPVYYVVRCVSEDDAAAAANVRQSLESQQKEAYFEEVYAEWQKAAKSFSVKSAYTSLPLPDSQ